jgi:transglutaminase-like putative cysteine protease
MILSLSISSLAAASGDEIEPKMVGSSEIRVDITWTVAMDTVPSGAVTARLFGLPSTAYQSAAFNATYGFVREADQFGNQVLKFSLPSEKTVEVAVHALVQVAYGEADAANASEAAFYTQASPLVELTDEIRGKALELSKGIADKEEFLVRATSWVHGAVNYSLAFENVSESSAWVYAHREGTCDEYSHLLLAILRSTGIPARFVAGFVYTGKAFGPHAWVEALIDGKWIPADATYNEALVLDATHVKFAQGRDQGNVKEEVSAVGAANISLARSASLSFSDFREFPDLFNLELKVPSYSVGEGSLELINATIVSKASKPLAVPLFLVTPNTTEVIEVERLAYLKPGQAVNETWKVIFPATMDERYVYNFTVELSSLGKKAVAYVEGKKGGRQGAEESLAIKDVYLNLGGDGAVLTAVIQNSGSKTVDANLFFMLGGGESQRAVTLVAGEERRIEFAFPRPERAASGEIKIIYSGNTIVQPFEISAPKPLSPSYAPADSAAVSPAVPTQAQDYELKLVVDDRFAAAAALIFIALVVILTRKRRVHYSETK